MSSRPIARYSPFAQTLHWITAVLVLVAFIYGPEDFEQRAFDGQLHETLGLAVLGLTVIRVLW